jgi:hypothetical protein
MSHCMVLAWCGCCVIILSRCCCFSLSVIGVVGCGHDWLWLVVAGEGLPGPVSSARRRRHPVSQRVGIGRMWTGLLTLMF